jgi:hypothetical protein
MTHRPTNHAANPETSRATTSHAQGKEQSEKNTVGDWMDGWMDGRTSWDRWMGWDGRATRTAGLAVVIR